MMARYLLDTNHLGDAVDRVSGVREKIYRASRAGHIFGTCVPVLCELEPKMLKSRHEAHNREILTEVLQTVRIWPVDRAIAPHYGTIFWDLRDRGRILSQVDIMLAALCRQMDLTLLTTDRDFEALPALRVENWVG